MKLSFRQLLLHIPTLLALALMCAAGVTPARAAMLIVTNVNDSGAGSLRAAIANAAEGDTISFAPSLSGQTIYLQSTLVISKSVTITASALAAKITISGDSDNNGTNDVQVFHINGQITVLLNSLIITKGISDQGGGIYNEGTLTITNSTVSANSTLGNEVDGGGGGIYNKGILTVANSTVSANSAGGLTQDLDHGGGIANRGGILTIRNSTISSNSAYYGGGIYSNGIGLSTRKTITVTNSTFSNNFGSSGGGISNFDEMTITNSTFSNNFADNGAGIRNGGGTGVANITNSLFFGNSAESSGGGITNGGLLTVTNSTFSGNSAKDKLYDYGDGGGIANYHILTVANSTFSGNFAIEGGGIRNGYRSLTLMNNTFSGNYAESGGGIYNADTGTLTFANNILANSSKGGNCITLGTINSNINNLIQDGSCNAALSGNPLLGPLANNGGTTQTFALQAGSPAIDAGSDTVCAAAPVNNLDQRGAIRPMGVHCDLGAYEYQSYISATRTPTKTPTPIAPVRVMINQAAGQADPISTGPIHFTAVFSEAVTGFTGADINFSGTTLTTKLIATVTESAPMNGTRYDVAITGMIPKGTVFVSIPAGKVNSKTRPAVNNTASTSTDNRVTFDYRLAEFGSNAANDGWLLESTETSQVGGSLDSTATTISVGDDASDRQYVGLLDFATGSLPDNAVIYAANLRLIQSSVTGINPFTTHGLLKSAIKLGSFGANVALQNIDFEAAPSALACNFEAVPEILEALGTAYRCVVLNTAFPAINRTGTTQFRLRFTLDDNDNMSADTFNFYSGNFAVSASQAPRLFVKYYIP